MTASQRIRRAVLPTAAAAVIGAGGFVIGAAEVIGIPTLAAASAQDGSQAHGIGFAIPANMARDIAGQLIESGRVTSGG